jgi:hypothetical protein
VGVVKSDEVVVSLLVVGDSAAGDCGRRGERAVERGESAVVLVKRPLEPEVFVRRDYVASVIWAGFDNFFFKWYRGYVLKS